MALLVLPQDLPGCNDRAGCAGCMLHTVSRGGGVLVQVEQVKDGRQQGAGCVWAPVFRVPDRQCRRQWERASRSFESSPLLRYMYRYYALRLACAIPSPNKKQQKEKDGKKRQRASKLNSSIGSGSALEVQTQAKLRKQGCKEEYQCGRVEQQERDPHFLFCR